MTGLSSMVTKRYLITKVSFPRWIVVVASLSNAFITLVVYDIGLVEAVEGGQFYTYGLTQIIGTWTSGLYVYDGIIYVETGGDLYAYGLVAAEPNTAFYDYGLFCLEPSGYLYVAGLFVVEPSALFFDYGPFVAPGGTYFNFGQQIGWGHL